MKPLHPSAQPRHRSRVQRSRSPSPAGLPAPARQEPPDLPAQSRSRGEGSVLSSLIYSLLSHACHGEAAAGGIKFTGILQVGSSVSLRGCFAPCSSLATPSPSSTSVDLAAQGTISPATRLSQQEKPGQKREGSARGSTSTARCCQPPLALDGPRTTPMCSTVLTRLSAPKPPSAPKRHQALTTGHRLTPAKKFHCNRCNPSLATSDGHGTSAPPALTPQHGAPVPALPVSAPPRWIYISIIKYCKWLFHSHPAAPAAPLGSWERCLQLPEN